MTEVEQLQEENEKLKKMCAKLMEFIETNGSAKLYYALNAKASEMADVLNRKSLTEISLDDPKDKTFDRLKVIWNDSASLSSAIKELGISAGITGDAEKDTKKPFNDRLADNRD